MDRDRLQSHPVDALAKAMQRIERGRFVRFRIVSGVRGTKIGSYPKFFFDGCWVPGLDITSVEMAVVETSIVVQMYEKRFRYTCR